jgi:NSS family neurotransmitter:Na+ symporter
MPSGTLAAFSFYLLLFAAALASAISMLELVVAPLTRLFGSRRLAAMLAGLAAWTLGLVTVLSFNVWSAWRPLAAVPGLAGANWFEALDHLTSNLLLPLGGFALALFAGWVVPDRLLNQELAIRGTHLRVLRALLRYVVPLGIAAVVLAPYLI